MSELCKKEKIFNICKTLINISVSLFVTLSLFMENGLKINYNQKMLMTIIYIVCFITLNKIFDKKIRIKGAGILAIVLTYFKYCHLIIDSKGYIHIVQNFSNNIGMSLTAIIGYVTFYFIIIQLIYRGINTIREKYNQNIEIDSNCKNRILNFIFNKHSFLMPFIIILLLWLPHIIVQFPATMAWDSDAEIAKFMGVSGEIFSSHYPPVHIWLLGKIITTSEKLFNNTNPGFFCLTMINVFVGAFVFANSFITMKKLKTPYIIRTMTLIAYSMLPIFVGSIMVTVKDNLYGLGMLLLITALIEYITQENFWKNTRCKVMYILAAVLLILTRNNGIHVMVLTVLAIIIKMIIEKKITLKRFSITIMPIVISIIIIQIVTITYNVLPGNPREKYPFFLQQSALYIKYNEKEISDWEKETLQKTFGYDVVANLYKPNIADPVKDTYKSFTLDYVKVYLYEFIKHPMTYVEATTNLVYSIFVPDITNFEYYTEFESTFYGQRMEEEQIESLKSARENLVDYYKLINKLPILNILSGYGVYVCLTLIIAIYLINDKRYKELLVLFPLLLTILILIISPVACSRYCYPLIFSAPMLIAMYAIKEKQIKENKI